MLEEDTVWFLSRDFSNVFHSKLSLNKSVISWVVMSLLYSGKIKPKCIVVDSRTITFGELVSCAQSTQSPRSSKNLGTRLPYSKNVHQEEERLGKMRTNENSIKIISEPYCLCSSWYRWTACCTRLFYCEKRWFPTNTIHLQLPATRHQHHSHRSFC